MVYRGSRGVVVGLGWWEEEDGDLAEIEARRDDVADDGLDVAPPPTPPV